MICVRSVRNILYSGTKSCPGSRSNPLKKSNHIKIRPNPRLPPRKMMKQMKLIMRIKPMNLAKKNRKRNMMILETIFQDKRHQVVDQSLRQNLLQEWLTRQKRPKIKWLHLPIDAIWGTSKLMKTLYLKLPSQIKSAYKLGQSWLTCLELCTTKKRSARWTQTHASCCTW